MKKEFTVCSLIKKKKKFSLYIRKFDGIGRKVIYEERLPNILGNSQYLTIYEEAFSHI
jgi:hypothetical protein